MIEAMTSQRRYVNFYPTRRLRHRNSNFWLHQKISLGSIYNPCKFGGDISTIEQVSGFAVNDVMTSRRRYVIEIQDFDLIKRFAFVQSIITKKCGAGVSFRVADLAR